MISGAGTRLAIPAADGSMATLQQNNSTYAEGDATVQRLWVSELTSGLHTLTLHYGTTKGGTHTYDYLTTWSWSGKKLDYTCPIAARV